ncbi:MAG: MerR family transcriptional regulator [Candidatus Nanopelagicales bacterium]
MYELFPAAVTHRAAQEALFDLPAGLDPAKVGFSGPMACNVARISYRQLDYWARTGLVEPSIRAAAGSGSARLYSFGDILMLQVVRRLLDSGVSLPNIRAAIRHLRAIPTAELSGLTIISDGASVYSCTSAEDITDIVRDGQGVFGIALGQVWVQVQELVSQLPGELICGDFQGTDELADRRARRHVS